MNIADRIQSLRKIKGISQEELADKIGVSRQAVSKWESEQSVPDIDKVLIMSEYFDVTTDYILKGIEDKRDDFHQLPDAHLFVIVSTVLNFIGLILACTVWYQEQVAMALVIGLVFMALGCMVYGVGSLSSAPASRSKAKYNFWLINIWLLSFIPMSFIYNMFFTGLSAPYPMIGNYLMAYPLFWLAYLSGCSAVVYYVTRHLKTI
ncbi:hypothetical protein SDC9_109302 [bioreactor metagenome]|uniref:HTH cro/C1-type domain-containing protein n=1 Tax=bioreactor metagenome TaxID=1076179 RepID=A0A645BCR3_9ZZZZ|nr:helix-turn-helix transcriptional regulator [Erysipelotrichaceae bacterium]